MAAEGAGQGDSIVLEEEVDPNYEPTEKEVLEYASWLGMDLEAEQDLFWIAREGLKAPLPENWKPCKTTDTEEIYYFNFSSGESTWDHPCDEFYRKLYEEHKQKRMQAHKTQDGDEKKQKEKEAVAELLGKKSGRGKKKKASAAGAKDEPLRAATLTKANPLEKKPLPGIPSKLGGLSALGPPSVGLKAAPSLGKLKGEAKDEEEEDEEEERPPSPRMLGKPPLGSILSKKALPSTSSSASLSGKADAHAEEELAKRKEELQSAHSKALRELEEELAKSKEELQAAHLKALRELEESNEDEMKAAKKKAQKQLDEVEEEGDARLRQLRKDLEKKRLDAEAQYESDELRLQRERKDKLSRVESETTAELSKRRQEIERDQQSELERMRTRHTAAKEQLEEEQTQQIKAIKTRLQAALGDERDASDAAIALKQEVKRLTDMQSQSQMELSASQELQARLKAELESLQRQMEQAQNQVSAQSGAALASDAPCAKCLTHDGRLRELEEDLRRHSEELSSSRSRLQDSERLVERLQQDLKASEKMRASASEISTELESLRSTNSQLRDQLHESELQIQRLQQSLNEHKCANAAGADNAAEKESLQAMNANLRARLEESNRQIEQLQQDLQQQMKSNAASSGENESLRSENEQMRKQVQELETKLERNAQQAAEQLQQLEANVRSTTEECNRWRQKNEQSQSRQGSGNTSTSCALCLQLQDELSGAKDEVETLTKTIAQIKQQLMKEANEKKTLGEQLGHAEAQADEARKQLGQLTSDIEALNKRAAKDAALRAEAEAARDSLQEEVGAAAQAKSVLESAKAGLERQVKDLAAQVDALRAAAVATAEAEASSAGPSPSKDVDRLQRALQAASREKETLASRIDQLEKDVEELAASARGLEVAKANEMATSRKKDSECKALQMKLQTLMEELDSASEKNQTLNAENVELKAAASKQRAKEQSTLARVGQLEDDLRDMETKMETQKTDIEEHKKKCRQAASLLDDKTTALRTLQSENETLVEQVNELQQQVSQLKASKQAQSSGKPNGITAASQDQELREAREQVSNLESKVDTLANEKRQLVDKNKQATAQRMELEKQLESIKADCEHLREQDQAHLGEIAKWKSRAETKSKEVDQVRSELDAVKQEQERLEEVVARERAEKADLMSAKTALEKTKRSLEGQLEATNEQLQEHEAVGRGAGIEAQTRQAQLKRLEGELERVKSELRGVQEERDSLATTAQEQAQECKSLDRSMRSLRNENSEQATRIHLIEEELSRVNATVLGLEAALQKKDDLLKRMEEAKEALNSQLVSATSKGEDFERVETQLKRKLEAAEVKVKALEETTSHGDFQVQLQLQRLEAEREALLSAKDRAEQVAKALERELNILRDDLAQAKSEATTAAARVQALTRERDDIQAAMLNAHNTATSFAATLPRSRENSCDAMLVKLQLADINKSELEQHLADVAAQLELATRRSALAESRSRDQAIAAEALQVEVASVRAALHKSHLAAVEMLPLVERLEYEHKKRLLKDDFLQQLRDFQEREEQALLRQKARLRAQHDTQTEELVTEIARKQRARLEREEEAASQLVAHARREHTLKVNALKQQLQTDMNSIEQELQERRRLRVEAANRQQDQEEEAFEARLREDRQAQREAAILLNKTKADDPEVPRSPGQVGFLTSGDDDKALQTEEDPASENASTHSSRVSVERRGNARQQSKRRSDREHWSSEKELLAKARAHVQHQKRELKKQADQLRDDQREWKRDARHASTSHQRAMLAEMQRMLDESVRQWQQRASLVREREAWLRKREKKIDRVSKSTKEREMLKTHARSSRRPRGFTGDDSEDSSGSSSEDNQSDWSSMLEAMNPSTSDPNNDWHASRWDRRSGWDAMATTSVEPDAAAVLRRAPVVSDGNRLSVVPTSSLFYAPATRNDWQTPAVLSSAWFRSRAVPSTMRTNTRQTDVIGRQIARWAQGRERVQHAATKQAAWLSDLCEQVKEYGDATYTTGASASGLASVAPFSIEEPDK